MTAGASSARAWWVRLRRLLARTLLVSAAIAALTFVAGCTPGKRRAGAAESCDGRGPVDSEQWIDSDGARLHLLVRGPDCDAPVVLWLHGGPGGAETPLFRYYDSALERHMIVAYLDQRGAGLSYDDSADPSRLTIAQHVADLKRVVDSLSRQFDGRDVTLIGHSWGAALGLLFAHRHPQHVARVIAVNPLTSMAASQKAEYDFALGESRARKDQAAIATLARVGPPPYDAEQEMDVQEIVYKFGGFFHRRPNPLLVVVGGVLEGLVGPFDIPSYLEATEASLKAMMPELLKLDLEKSVPSVDCPVVMMLGRHDHQIDNAAARAYLGGLKAPSKALIEFDHSAHNIPFEEPDAFVADVERIVLAPGS